MTLLTIVYFYLHGTSMLYLSTIVDSYVTTGNNTTYNNIYLYNIYQYKILQKNKLTLLTIVGFYFYGTGTSYLLTIVDLHLYWYWYIYFTDSETVVQCFIENYTSF